ncbi:daptide biosynthesis intramembrane metalloprotease [Microbacterium sp. SLBN-146]|uniref:daptide biosynthesis intramembrane metalloprotease n=1 Tax=Microbacterium sp. SLBN-146 TaxID=2768457 RepID=UPI001153E19B|nr:daptide biosynthesis intramembrane metalloprotease [Microbacterium sp. SLBN-146]TQJ30479.1 putative peptide zinc metalloprotease protein [Microbacterium sp. SLBN-146]
MAALTLDSRPRLADTVAFEESAAGDGQWIVLASDVPVSRVSRPVVDLLRSLDGRTPVRDLQSRHDSASSPTEFLALVRRFEGRGLIAGAERRPPGRFSYRPPLTVQLASLGAPALFSRLERLRRRLLRGWMLTPIAVLIVLGAAALAVQAPTVLALLTRPLPVSSFLAVVAVLVAATFAHEAAHGMTLAGYGVLPRRAGVMLFYLSPAFFVDVTNGWRLADRRGRVAVALAGPAVNAALASAAALVAAIPGMDDTVRDALLILATASWSIVLVNLIPFVRFDGYLALMSALDIPNLRTSAIHDVRDTTGRVLFGSSRQPRRLPQAWVLPFGVMSVVTPLLLIALALDRIIRALSGGGPGGAWAILALAFIVAVGVTAALVKAVRHLFRTGARPWRVILVGTPIVAVAVCAGFIIPVQTTLTTGFVTSDASLRLVVPGAVVPDIAPGTAVTLYEQGMLGRRAIAQAVVTARSDAPTSVPLGAVYPFDAPGVVLDGRTIAEARFVGARPSSDSVGIAVIPTGRTSAWGALWSATVLQPLTTIGVGAPADSQ